MVLTVAWDGEFCGTSDRLICVSLGYYKNKEFKSETYTNKEAFKRRLIELAWQERKKGSRLQTYCWNTWFDYSRTIGFNEGEMHIKGKREGFHIIAMGNIFLAEYLDKEGKELISFYDGCMILRKSLKIVGDIIGQPKGEVNEKTLEKLHNDNSQLSDFTQEEIKEIKKYNIQDCKVTLDFINYIKNFMEKEGYKPQRLISAGQIAMQLFNRHIYQNKYQKYLMEWKENPYDIFKKGYEYYMTKYPEEIHEAYRAGRLEAIQTGEFTNTTNLDMNSFYSWAELQIPFPLIKTEQYIEDPENTYTIDEIINQIGITNCVIKCPKQELGYLPIRFKLPKSFGDNINEIIYPKHKCTMYGTWTNLELKRAIELGYKIQGIKWTINFAKAEINPLKEFVLNMYEQRKKNELGKTFYKLVLNNLHGKFAQRTQKKDFEIGDVGLAPQMKEKEFNIYTRIDDFNYLYTKDLGINYGRNYAPIISAYITAKARDLLYNEAIKIPIQDLLYLSIDGIIFKGDHINKYKIGKEIGEMKYVKFNEKEMKNVKTTIYGKNNYIVDDDLRLSGVKKEFVKGYEEGQTEIKFGRFKNIKNSESIKDSFAYETLKKDFKEIQEKTEALKEYIKTKKELIDVKYNAEADSFI